MNLKTALFAFVTMGLVGGLTAGTGCAKNDCDDAADRIASKYDDCGVDTVDGGDSGDEVECTDELGEAAQKQAGCIENADCGALDGSDAEAALSLVECFAS